MNECAHRETDRALWWFFGTAFALTWGVQLPGVLALNGLLPGPYERYLPLLGLGAFGPLVAAMLCARREPGGVRGLFARLHTPGLSSAWFLVAPWVSGLLLVIGLALGSLLLAHPVERWLFLPLAPERLVAMVVFSVGEEVGWRGYAYPMLRKRLSPLYASLLLGLLWGLWHLPMLSLAGIDGATSALLILAFLPAGSLVFGWFYERTKGNLTIAVLLHMGAHLNNSHLALPSDPWPAYVHTGAYVLAAIILLLVARRTLLAAPTLVTDQRGDAHSAP